MKQKQYIIEYDLKTYQTSSDPKFLSNRKNMHIRLKNDG